MLPAGQRSAHPFSFAGKRNQPRSPIQTNQCSDSVELRYSRGAAVLSRCALAVSTGPASPTNFPNRQRPTHPLFLHVRHWRLAGLTTMFSRLNIDIGPISSMTASPAGRKARRLPKSRHVFSSSTPESGRRGSHDRITLHHDDLGLADSSSSITMS